MPTLNPDAGGRIKLELDELADLHHLTTYEAGTEGRAITLKLTPAEARMLGAYLNPPSFLTGREDLRPPPSTAKPTAPDKTTTNVRTYADVVEVARRLAEQPTRAVELRIPPSAAEAVNAAAERFNAAGLDAALRIEVNVVDELPDGAAILAILRNGQRSGALTYAGLEQ